MNTMCATVRKSAPLDPGDIIVDRDVMWLVLYNIKYSVSSSHFITLSMRYTSNHKVTSATYLQPIIVQHYEKLNVFS